MRPSHHELVYTDNGQTALTELKKGQGAAWTGSRHEGSLFVVVSPTVDDGGYSDEEIDALLEAGAIVKYFDQDDGFKPAREIGVTAAIELFVLGAAQVDGALTRNEALSEVVNPLSLTHLGRPTREQGADFMSLGRIWALMERAKGLKPFEVFNAREIGKVVFDDVIAADQQPHQAKRGPELRRLH